MSNKNTQVLLARRPSGRPVPEDFEVVERDIPTPSEGEALLQNLYVSLDAGFRNWMDEGAGDDVERSVRHLKILPETPI